MVLSVEAYFAFNDAQYLTCITRRHLLASKTLPVFSKTAFTFTGKSKLYFFFSCSALSSSLAIPFALKFAKISLSVMYGYTKKATIAKIDDYIDDEIIIFTIG